MKEIILKKLDGRTQRWLGSQVGMTDVDLSNSINGYRRFKLYEFERVCTVLGITESEAEEIKAAYSFNEKTDNKG